jgi:hypothetical protein
MVVECRACGSREAGAWREARLLSGGAGRELYLPL